MRSLALNAIIAATALSVSGCIPFMRASDPPAVQPVQVQVKPAPVKKTAAPKTVRKPVVHTANEGNDGGGGGDGGNPW